MILEALYATGMEFIEVRGDQAVFRAVTPAKYTWPKHDEHGEARPIADSEFIIDRRYWEFLGKPDVLAVGFSNEAGWQKWVGEQPPRAEGWKEATGA